VKVKVDSFGFRIPTRLGTKARRPYAHLLKTGIALVTETKLPFEEIVAAK
jgi:hypothetical protein